MTALEEAEQHAGRAVRRRVVEREPHRARRRSCPAPDRPSARQKGSVVDRHALGHRAERHPLGELVAKAGERRVVGDPAGERRRDRHDRRAGPGPRRRPRAPRRRRRRAGSRAPGAPSSTLLAELLGHAASRSAATRRRSGPAARRPRCRRASRGCRPSGCRRACGAATCPPARPPRRPRSRARGGCARRACTRCGASRWRPSASRAGRRPAPPRAPRAGTLRASRLSLPLGALHVEQHERVDPRDRAAVAAQAPRRTRARSAHRHGWGTSRRRARAASAASRSWVGPIHCGAHLHDLAAADVLVQHPAADALARLHDDDRRTLGRQPRAPPRARRARRRSRPHLPRGVERLCHCRATLTATASLCCGPMASPPRSEREEERRLNVADARHRERRVRLGGRRHLAALDRRHLDRRGGHPCDRRAGQRAAAPAHRERMAARGHLGPPGARSTDAAEETPPLRRRQRGSGRPAARACPRHRQPALGPRAGGSRSGWSSATTAGAAFDRRGRAHRRRAARRAVARTERPRDLARGRQVAQESSETKRAGASPAPAETRPKQTVTTTPRRSRRSRSRCRRRPPPPSTDDPRHQPETAP